MSKAIFSATFLLFLATAGHAETAVYFSPGGGCTAVIINEIQKARQSIDIAMYSLSSRPLARALLQARDRGVKVRIYADKGQKTARFTSCRYLENAGILVKYSSGPGLMHNKLAIIDTNIVITGSFNWTASAERKNAENLLVITDKTIINKYAQMFETLWNK